VSDHLITPPPQLIRHWRAELPAGVFDGYKYPQRETELCIQAAQWGADQELAACCEWLECNYNYPQANPLRVARRPKPPSLKELALAILDDCSDRLDGAHENTIRCALEALPND
jgi:hypothetical protein